MATKKKKVKFKSKWEQTVADQLVELGFPIKYETKKIKYVIPESIHTYSVDFECGKWLVEAKGKFVAQDRKKHLLVKEQNPNLKLLILFQNANQRLSKRSNTTYGQWCEKNGIRWKHKTLGKEDLK